MVKIAKKAKIENVNFDVLSFGEDEEKTDILHKFITTISGKERTGSHLAGRPNQILSILTMTRSLPWLSVSRWRTSTLASRQRAGLLIGV